MKRFEDFFISEDYFREYVEKEEKTLSLFERLCKFVGKFFKIPPPLSIKKSLEKPIWLSGMKVSPEEVFSLSIFSLLISFIVFLPLAILDVPSTLILLIFPFFIFYNVLFYPHFYTEVLKIRAGNESVSVILYMISYLSYLPIYENALAFAATNSHGPLGNDLKKIIWGVISGKYANVKEGLKEYSVKWTYWNEDFVNAISTLGLVEIASGEPERNEILKVAAERLMKGNYKRMEMYADALKQPSLLLLFFGIMFPLMGLVMFPLVSIFLSNMINPIYIGLGYTVFLPFFLFWFLYRIISKRPGVYSHSEKIEEVRVRKNIKIGKVEIPILPLSILIGVLIAIPGILYYIEVFSYHYLIFSTRPKTQAIREWQEFCLQRYSSQYILKDTFRAMFLFWGLSISIVISTYLRSSKPYLYDQFLRSLEKEFEYGLFELQNALQRNVPVESAILKVVEEYERTGKKDNPICLFFLEVYRRISEGAYSLQEALFGEKGLIKIIPSSLVKNIMAIVSSAISKGSSVASNVLRNIVYYLNIIGEIENLIIRSMKDIVSNLEMQVKLILPFMAAIVAGASVIVIQLLQSIAKTLQGIERLISTEAKISGGISNVLEMIKLEEVMPPTYMQLIAGVYLIETTIIISYFLTGILRGFNRVQLEYTIYRYLTLTSILFSILFFGIVLIFQPVITRVGV